MKQMEKGEKKKGCKSKQGSDFQKQIYLKVSIFFWKSLRANDNG